MHVFTSFTYSYLSRARVLAKSVKRSHPDWRMWAVLVDTAPPGFDDSTWRTEFDHVLDASTLFPGVWSRWLFKHDIVEACTAVKGHALLHLMSEGAEKIIYLDPDIAVFHDLNEIDDNLDRSSIILTPHQIDQNMTESEIADNELVSMKYGIYNLGFIAVRNDAEGRKMAKWWASRLFNACYDDVKNGIFTDQKYCDLVPSLFGNVRIERDPGYNVASWNLSRRAIEITPEGDLLANRSRLKFYHFTKINSDGDAMTHRYANGQIAAFEVWNWYKREVKANELPGIPKGYWRYARFDDGAIIPKHARVLYRTRADLMSAFERPFESGPGSFQEWYRDREERDDESEPSPHQRGKVLGEASVAAKGSVAAVVHVHYPELLPELRDLLSRYVGSLKLFVTTTPEKVARIESILVGFPHPIEFVVSDNRGRDIRPFMLALPKVLAQGYDYLLKLHTKKSNHRADGDIWRRELLSSLADPAELAWTIERLRKRPDIGIVGPDGHVLDMDAYWGSNESRVRELADRMGIGTIVPDPNVFVAGTMFVARRAALAALASLELDESEFETEAGQTDGTLAHAVERVLTFSAAAAGLRVAAKPASAAGSSADLAFRSHVEYRFAPRSDTL